MSGVGGAGMGGGPGADPGLGSSLEGQGGGNRDTYQLPDERLSRAKYAAEVDREDAGAARPGLIERFKRWFAARF
jgi:hypothetical protein